MWASAQGRSFKCLDFQIALPSIIQPASSSSSCIKAWLQVYWDLQAIQLCSLCLPRLLWALAFDQGLTGADSCPNCIVKDPVLVQISQVTVYVRDVLVACIVDLSPALSTPTPAPVQGVLLYDYYFDFELETVLGSPAEKTVPYC